MNFYLCPALMNTMLFIVMFAVLYSAGQRGMTLTQCAWLGGISQGTYVVASLISGLLLSRRNARMALLASIWGIVILGGIALLSNGFITLLIVLAIIGVFLAIFCNAFQTFMRGASPPGSLARSVAWYTLSWSSGYALGFLSSGSCYRMGTLALLLLTIIVGATISVILLRYQSQPLEALAIDQQIEQDAEGGHAADSRYVWVAWCMIFTVMFIQRPLLTFIPSLGTKYGLSPFMAGFPLFMLMAIQGAFGKLMAQNKNWLYRKTPFWIFQGTAALVFLVLWLKPIPWLCLIGVCLLGLYTGFACFCAVYYANNSGQRSWNVGVNECLFGLGAFAGLLVCEALMKRTGRDESMFLVCGSALLVSIILQTFFTIHPKAGGSHSVDVREARREGVSP